MRPAAEDRADVEADAGGPDEAVETVASDEPGCTANAEPGAAPGTRTERVLAWLLPSANSAGTIYGLIAIGALLAVESGLRETYPETVGSAMLALSLYWLAHAYADLLGQRLDTHERLTATALAQNLLHDWAIVRGGALPLLVLLACWAAGTSQETAVTVDLWTTAASLLAFELLAGLRARVRPAELLLEGCVGAAMGLGVLALRVILH